MSGFDERDLMAHFVDAGFESVDLTYEVSRRRTRARRPEIAAFLTVRPNPNMVSYEEAARRGPRRRRARPPQRSRRRTRRVRPRRCPRVRTSALGAPSVSYLSIGAVDPITVPNVVSGPFGARLLDRPRGVDQADVAEGLGKVAEELARLRVDLFGEETDVVHVARRTREGLVRTVEVADERKRLREPKRAQEEGALAGLEDRRSSDSGRRGPVRRSAVATSPRSWRACGGPRRGGTRRSGSSGWTRPDPRIRMIG